MIFIVSVKYIIGIFWIYIQFNKFLNQIVKQIDKKFNVIISRKILSSTVESLKLLNYIKYIIWNTLLK